MSTGAKVGAGVGIAAGVGLAIASTGGLGAFLALEGVKAQAAFGLAFKAGMLGATIGGGIGSIIDPLKPRMGEPETQELMFPSSDEGICVPTFYGTTQLAGNIVWVDKVVGYSESTVYQEGGSKNAGRIPTRYRNYRVTFDVVLANCYINDLYAIYVEENPLMQDNGELVTLGLAQTTYGHKSLSSNKGVIRFFLGADSQYNVDMTGTVSSTGLNNTLSLENNEGIYIRDAKKNRFCWARFYSFDVGTQNRIPSLRFVVRRSPSLNAIVSGIDTYATIGTYYYNPVNAILDILYSHVGIPEAYFNDSSFLTAAEVAYNEGLGVNLICNQISSAGSYIENLLFHVDGILCTGNDGKISIKLLGSGRSDNDYTTISITEDDIIEAPEYSEEGVLLNENQLSITFPRLVFIDTENQLVEQRTIMLQEGIDYAKTIEAEGGDKLVKYSTTLYAVYVDDPAGDMYLLYSEDDGLTWTKVSTKINATYDGRAPALAYASNDFVHIAYVSDSGDSLYYRKFNTTLHAFSGGTTVLLTLSQNDYSASPVIRCDAYNNPHIIWAQSHIIWHHIYDGASWAYYEKTDSVNDLTEKSDVDFVFKSNGNIIVTWLDEGASDSKDNVLVACQSSSNFTGIFTYKPKIDAMPEGQDAYRPRITVDRNNNGYVAWWGCSYPDTENRILCRKIINLADQNSFDTGSIQSITTGGEDSRDVHVSYLNTGSDHFLQFVWRSYSDKHLKTKRHQLELGSGPVTDTYLLADGLEEKPYTLVSYFNVPISNVNIVADNMLYTFYEVYGYDADTVFRTWLMFYRGHL